METLPAIGIMQGRLSDAAHPTSQSFPNDWEAEFMTAREIGFTSIEWLWDTTGGSNVLATEAGQDRIMELSGRTGVSVRSVCAHFLVAEGAGVSTAEAELETMVDGAAAIGATWVVLPFFGQDSDFIEEMLTGLANATSDSNVGLHVETDLPPHELGDLMLRIPSSRVKVNYDCGNSAALGYRHEQEIATYADRIGSVHLKDKDDRGISVALGSGIANVDRVMIDLASTGYSGSWVLETPRWDDRTKEVQTMATRNRRYVVDVFARGVAS